MKKLHPKQELRANQRAYASRHKKEMTFVLGLFALVAFLSVIGIFTDPAFASTGMTIFAGTNIAVMMTLGDVGDVSDVHTSGQNIYNEVYLIDIDEQIDKAQAFPLPNAAREVGTIPMLTGQYMKKWSAHSFPKYLGSGEKGDNTVTGNGTFDIVMAGMRSALITFAEEHIGKKFIIIFRELDSSTYNILGSVDRPVTFKKFEGKNDGDGRFVNYTFERNSVKQYNVYTGSMVTQAAGTNVADSTTLTLSAGNNVYSILNGSAATYAINAVAGLTASDKGRIITLLGGGTTNSATIADGSTFILEDGSTWTAKSGSKLVLKVLDSGTLVEVGGSRIQTT